MLVCRVEDRLNGPPPILKVRRPGELRGVQDGLFGGRELPVPHPHLLFQFDHIPKEAGRLLRAQVCHIKQKPLDRLPFVGKEITPLVELLIDEGKKRKRQALEQPLAQSVLEILRQLIFCPHDSFQPSVAARRGSLTAKLGNPPALRIHRRAAEQARKSGTKIDVENGTFDDLRLVDGRSQSHHPTVASGIRVGAVIEESVGR
jgi:hypothetical protein